MTEYFRITGLNNINFDQAIPGPYRLTGGSPPAGMSEPLSRQEVLGILPRLPLGIRSHVLSHGLSIITCQINIQGATDTLMEQYRHDLSETLEDAGLYIETQGARGTQTVLRYKMDNVAVGNDSYKTIFYGMVDELGGRDVLGSKVKESFLQDMRLTLYCEPYWRPETAVTLGPNEIYCPSFEEDGDANGRADDWAARAASVLAMESTIVLHGCSSQKVTTNAANEGIESTVMVAPAGVTDAVAYAWVCRPAAGSDIRAILRDTTNNVDRATALLSAATATATGKGGNTWYRLDLSSNAIVPAANHELWIESTAATATVFYVDKAFWKWDATTIPDEWCDHWLAYNHYDTVVGATHEGHINYFDVDDLKGDVEARLLMLVEFEKIADLGHVRELITGRRTRGVVCGFYWWLEGERVGATDRTNWAPVALTRCSGGSRLTDNAAAAGEAQFSLLGALFAGTADLAYIGGSFDVFAAVYTDDKDNTQYRCSYYPGGDYAGGPSQMFNQWVKQEQNDWELIHMGMVDFDPFIRAGLDPYDLQINIEYQKDAGGDVAELDCVWLLPRDEPQTLLSAPGFLTAGNYWEAGKNEDFDYLGIQKTVPPPFWAFPPNLCGNIMTLMPRIENRLYFVVRSWNISLSYVTYEAHDSATGPADALEMIVNIDYLPQYISPLE